MSSLPAILLLAGFCYGAVWLVKNANENSRDNQGRPINDSFGQAIDYGHNIAYIPDTKDPVIIPGHSKSALRRPMLLKTGSIILKHHSS